MKSEKCSGGVESCSACAAPWLQGSPGQTGGRHPGQPPAPRPAWEHFTKDLLLVMLLKSDLTSSGGRSLGSSRCSGTSPAWRGFLCQDGWRPVATPGKNPGWKNSCWFVGLGKVCSEAFGLGWAVSGCKMKLFCIWEIFTYN